jgi:peptidoglycan hydrolase CwlO-like protein
MLTKSSNQSAMKQKIKQNILNRSLIGITAIVLVLVGVFGVAPIARASLQEQINELQAQNSVKQEKVEGLEDEATSIEDKINRLQDQINGLQAEISKNQSAISNLENDIRKAEKELDKQKELLGSNIREMYLEGDVSTLEMLASSKDLSEFVDKQQYRNSVQNKIADTLDKIRELKQKLDDQKVTLERRLKNQQLAQTEIREQRGEQDALLGLNENQRNKIDGDIKQNSKKIEELKRQQALENMRLFGGSGGVLGGGSYPWGYAKCIHTGQVDGPCYNYDWGIDGSIWNPNTGGYGYRNCTDYVSWKIRSQGRYVPSGLGNAKMWDNNMPSSSTPKAGDAAVSNGGYYGHVMYVEAVNGNGTITISDYNRAGTGKYSTSTISSSGLSFISF